MASRYITPVFDGGKGVTPADGLQLFFFATGTSTPKDTYTTEAASIANANPVISDANGVFPDIFISGKYKVQFKDKNGVGVGFVETDPVNETVGAGDSNNDKRYGPIFATEAAMVAANPVSIDGIEVVVVSGMTIHTQGEISAGDGLGREYLAVSSAAFGGAPDEDIDLTLSNGVVAVRQDGLALDPDDSSDSVTIAAWGDSLTAGTGGTPYPTTLQDGSSFSSVFDGGVGGETSAQIKTRLLADTARLPNTVAIWAGRNNYTAPSTVEADIASMVAALGHNRFLILSILNGDFGTFEQPGGQGYIDITAINTASSKTYPRNYFDIRAYLISDGLTDAGISPTAQDLIDIGNDTPPTSLRSDTIHLNTAGYTVVANKVRTEIYRVMSKQDAFATDGDIASALSGERGMPIGKNAFLPEINGVTVRVGPSRGVSANLSLSGDESSLQVQKGFIPLTDATYDLGFSISQQRWKDGFFTGLVYSTTMQATGSGASNTLTLGSSPSSASGGLVSIKNAAGTEKWRYGLRDMTSGAEGETLKFGYLSGSWSEKFQITTRGTRLNGGPEQLSGAGSPEGVISASIGATYINTSGGAGTTLYVKESGSGTTGWIGK